MDEGRPCTPEAKLLEFVQGADVLIIDAQYSREEYQRHIGWGHGCADDVVRLALAAQVKHLYLFHHDPRHDDDFVDAMVKQARELVKESGSSLVVEAAREGARVLLGTAG
jgi:ribonuclease BN (tRNA processing enzyme)